MNSTELGDLWDRLTGTQSAPEQWLVVVTAALALIAVVPNPIWRLARNTITIAHEGGHG
ncbi:M50 family peptidase, partial [Streptomyces sp. SID8455]|nr:M50 family peptidase [Streptomyces sp. SID8455]